MPSFSVAVPHHLSQEEATTRIQGLLGKLKDQYGDQISNLSENWQENTGDFSLTVMNMKVSGRLEVLPNEAKLSGDIPFAALPFKGQIENMVRQKAQEVLS